MRNVSHCIYKEQLKAQERVRVLLRCLYGSFGDDLPSRRRPTCSCASAEGRSYRENNSEGLCEEIETDRFLCTRKLSLEKLSWRFSESCWSLLTMNQKTSQNECPSSNSKRSLAFSENQASIHLGQTT